MTARTASVPIDHFPDTQLREFQVGASQTIYKGSYVGVDPAGYLTTFVPGDVYVGIAYEEADNSSGSAGDEQCRVYTTGDFRLALSGVAQADHGKAVYATDDATLSLTGHPDAFAGRIVHYDSSGKAVVRHPSQVLPLSASDFGSIDLRALFAHTNPAGAASATTYNNQGFQIKAILGLGNVNIATDAGVTSANGGVKLQLDNTSEIALASIRTPAIFTVSKGVTFEARLHAEDRGAAAALDIDWGLGSVLGATSELDIDDAEMANLCAFHMDGNSDNILAHSDNAGVAEIAAVDTLIDNIETDAEASYKDFKVIARPSGACELWVDRVRVLATTAFAMTAASIVAGWINMEKTADTVVAELNIHSMRVAGGKV